MSKTLLDAVNAILKRTNNISGDAGALSSLTDGARQNWIDVAVQVVNEGLDELYLQTNEPRPLQSKEATITLVQGQRNYTLPTDLVRLHWPLIDKTNRQLIREAPSYEELLLIDLEQDDTGLPHWAVIRPTDGVLWTDRAPTSADAGKVYTFQYDKDLALSLATDTMPFSDAAFRAMTPAWVQLWKREKNNEFDGDLFNANIGRAARIIREGPPREHYSPRA